MLNDAVAQTMEGPLSEAHPGSAGWERRLEIGDDIARARDVRGRGIRNLDAEAGFNRDDELNSIEAHAFPSSLLSPNAPAQLRARSHLRSNTKPPIYLTLPPHQ